MADVTWIKVATGMFEDEKIRLIEAMPEADKMLIIWIKLIILAGKTNDGGLVYLTESTPYTEEMLATIFNRPVDIVSKALKTLEQYGMVDIDDNQYIYICNWEKHQNIKGLEKIREDNRERKRRERKRKKLPNTQHNSDGHVTVTQCHSLEKELDIEKKKKKNNYDYSNEFEQFWSMYPKRIDKKKAMKSFRIAIKNHSLDTILVGTEQYAKQVKNVEKQFIKNPSTFLNNESFLNGLEEGGVNNGTNETATTIAKQYGLDF